MQPDSSPSKDSSASAPTWTLLLAPSSGDSSDMESTASWEAPCTISKVQHRAAQMLDSCNNQTERDKATRLLQWHLTAKNNLWTWMLSCYEQFSLDQLMCMLAKQHGVNAVADVLYEIEGMMERYAVLPNPPF